MSKDEPKTGMHVILVSDEFPLKAYAREQLAKTIDDAEKRFAESDSKRYGFLEYQASQALSPAKYEERKQQQAREPEENIIRYFRVILFGYLAAHVDSQRDYWGMRGKGRTVTLGNAEPKNWRGSEICEKRTGSRTGGLISHPKRLSIDS